MEPDNLIDLLEREPEAARALLRRAGSPPGLSRAFARRVLQHYASDSAAAIRLASHWRTVLRYGDEPAPVHRARAIALHLRGRWRPCADAFILAGDTATDPIERLSFKVGAVDALARAGRPEEALDLAQRLVEGLEASGEAGLAARVKLNLASVLVWQDRMQEARSWLEEALPVLERHGFALETASARLALSSTHLYGGSLAEATAQARRAREEALSMGLEHLADLCDANLAHAELLSGRPDQALDRLLRLRERFSDTPADLARSLEFLGDAYMGLNLWPEASDAYREALLHASALVALHRAHIALGRSEAQLAQGDAKGALASARHAAARYRRLGNRAWAAAAAKSASRALQSLGRVASARRELAQAIREAREAGADYHLADALLSSLETAQDPDLLDEAREIVLRQGYLGLLWKVYWFEARAREGDARLDAFERMFETILAGRAQTASFVASANYLRDKAAAIAEYLQELLRDGSAQRIEEALRVIASTRSVTLLDEVLSARRQALPEGLEAQLEALRTELRELGGDEAGGQARRLGSRATPIAHVQRRWIQLTRELQARTAAIVPPPDPQCAVFVQSREGIAALLEHRIVPLRMTPAELDRALAWLQFELLAPLADREADGDEALALLCKLSERLVSPWLDRRAASVSPDGVLWRVPWAACAAVAGDAELELRLHPGLGGNAGLTLPRPERVALWAYEAPDLPHASVETRALLARFPHAHVATTSDEARAQLREAYDLVHVVAHAKHRASNPMFSAIQFADGPLFATEIARSDLRATLVTLSACETGAMSILNRDEPDGIARAFLARGARNVVASMWELDDEAASLTFGHFFAHLEQGATVAESLRLARREVREWRKHPYFWGSLALYGGYSQ